MELKKEVQAENIYTAVLTAGIVLSMACLKHLQAVTSLFEQWRAWVFLVLNLVLLAIFFTSTRSITSENQDCKNQHETSFKVKGKKSAKRVCPGFDESEKFQEIKVHSAESQSKGQTKTKRVSDDFDFDFHETCGVFGTCRSDDESEIGGNVVVDKEDVDEPSRLSNEELNERVEAFITMFRQHLVLDARRGRDRDRGLSRPRQSKIMNTHKVYRSNTNVSTHEVACSV